MVTNANNRRSPRIIVVTIRAKIQATGTDMTCDRSIDPSNGRNDLLYAGVFRVALRREKFVAAPYDFDCCQASELVLQLHQGMLEAVFFGHTLGIQTKSRVFCTQRSQPCQT